jgi:plasmid maintenance system antidote protein VapI
MKRKSIQDYPIGAVIEGELKSKEMTQVELSARTRISQPVINDIVKGRRGANPAQLVKIGLILGLDAFELGRMQSDYEIMKIITPIIGKEQEE